MDVPAHPVTVADAAVLRARRAELVALLADAVTDNASVGFVLPVDRPALERYWDGVARDVAAGERIVLMVERGARVAGSVQVAPCGKDNGRHRAEIQKLLVRTADRRQGIARTLMAAAEAQAQRAGCDLLLLDTRTGSAAEALYHGLGWRELGRVPDYARDPDRTLADCTFFWKRIAEAA
ncbi:MAG: GNAT family N-acetyltransferase [Burkholderiales bacterium]